MIQNLSIIGGDLRYVKLANMLSKDGIKISTYGLNHKEIIENKNISKCTTLDEILNKNEIVLLPLPLTKNNVIINSTFSENELKIKDLIYKIKNKKVIAGNIKEDIEKILSLNNNEVIDLMKIEELTILNTIPTAEGTLQIAIEKTDKTIYDSNVLILGFGRVGKTVANRFYGVGANVYCEARKEEDLALIKTFGYRELNLLNLKDNLMKFDIIINTIPAKILGKEEIRSIKTNCLIIDLASLPGGVSEEAKDILKERYIHALALPGKVAPTSSAVYIRKVLYNIFNN